MAKVYKSFQGRKTSKVIAELDGVQAELEARTFEIAARAEQALLEHRYQGHSAIDIDHGDIDWYVTLNDDRGQKAAMSIEYGHEAYELEVIDEKTGERFVKEVPASDGLFILANAAHLPRRRKGVNLGRVTVRDSGSS